MVGLRFARDALKNLRDDRPNENSTIVVEQGFHDFLFRRLRAVEERNPDAGVNENQTYRSQPLRASASYRPW